MLGRSREGMTNVTFDIDFEEFLEREEKWIMAPGGRDCVWNSWSLKRARGFEWLKKSVQGHPGETGCKAELAQDHKVSQVLRKAVEVFLWEHMIRNAFWRLCNCSCSDVFVTRISKIRIYFAQLNLNFN